MAHNRLQATDDTIPEMHQLPPDEILYKQDACSTVIMLAVRKDCNVSFQLAKSILQARCL